MKFIFGPFWVFPLHEVQQRSSPTRPTELTHQKTRTNPPADPLGNSNNPNSPNNSNTPKTQTTQCTPYLSHSSSSSHFHCFHLSIVFRTIHILHFRMFVGSSYVCKFMFLHILFFRKRSFVCSHFLDVPHLDFSKFHTLLSLLLFIFEELFTLPRFVILDYVLSYSFYCLSSSDSFACSSS